MAIRLSTIVARASKWADVVEAELVPAGGTYVILVKNSEAGAGKFGWISVRKKLFVNSQKARLRQLAVRTILSESFVPFFYLLL